MRYAKIEDNTVVQIQPNKEAGFIKVDDNVVCGMVIHNDNFIVPTPSFEQAKRSKMTRLFEKFNTDAISVSSASPHEMVSWRKQEDEARAYTADNTVATPFIDAQIATRQLETKAELVIKIIANADAYQVAYAGLLGKYQNLVSKIKSATTQAELDAIVW